MTDDRRDGNGRRTTDEINTKLDSHIERFTEFEEMVAGQWFDLIEILEGPEIRRLDGSTERTGGVLDDLSDIKHQLSNGGVRIKLPVGVWAAISVAIVSGLFTVVAAVVG